MRRTTCEDVRSSSAHTLLRKLPQERFRHDRCRHILTTNEQHERWLCAARHDLPTRRAAPRRGVVAFGTSSGGAQGCPVRSSI